MTTRWNRFEIATGTGAGFLCIAFACVFLEAGAIETGIARGAVAALGDAGLHWSAVAPEGRSIVINGGAPDEATAAAASRRVARVPGVRTVTSRVAVIGAAGTCQRQIDAALGDGRVAFRKGLAEITPGSEAAIAAVAGLLVECAARVQVAVHAEPGGNAAVALALTQRRAELVARRLVALGVDPGRVEAVGHGVTQPVASVPAVVAPDGGAAKRDDEGSGRPPHRRVEFRILGAAT
jgi:outer membrane protein OmpA-like peptidoglycan-associated protein